MSSTLVLHPSFFILLFLSTLSMSPIRLILSSLWFHWRTNVAAACGVAVGTAVLTGALLVGDSMRGSLRHLILDRLGRIDEALTAGHFFRAALADEVAADSAAPVILLGASLENADPKSSLRANQVDLIGCDARFWQLGNGEPQRLPQPREIVLNQPLAEQLGAGPGDAVLLRLPRPSAIPADSALGKKQESISAQRLIISEVIPAEGLGRFGLRPTQRLPRNAYVPLQWLQDRLNQPDRANTILSTDDDKKNSRGLTAPGMLAGKVRLSDYGLNVDRTAQGYWNITSDRMLFDPGAEQAILDALGRVRETHRDNTLVCFTHPTIQPALTYLANTLACHGREVPYSTVTAIDFTAQPPLGPFLSAQDRPLPPLGPDEIALNTWAAEQLQAKVGDAVQLSYFEPESIDGQVREKSVSLRLAAIVKLAGPAADRGLTPSVKGITDELTMADWDPPFPFDAKRIRPVDEEYWDRYGPTPKAFVSLAAGRRLWGSRFGRTTSIRVAEGGGKGREERGEGRGKPQPYDGQIRNPKSEVRNSAPLPSPLSSLLQQHLDPAAMGMVFRPVKSEGLSAAAGTTPFGVLFVCFSFFVIAAAVMVTALLFRLGIEQRASQLGTLLAVGLSRRQVGRLLLGEGLCVAAAGSAVGVPAGIGYAALMLLGLRTWWLAAVATPFLRLHVTVASLAIGGASGLAVAFLAIWFSVRRLGRLSPRRLLAGLTTAERQRNAIAASGSWRLRELFLVVVSLAPTVVLLLVRLNDEVRAGAFFMSGAVALAALLTLVWFRLQAGMTGPAARAGSGNLVRLALRNAARNPGRSTLTVGLVAAATFVIVAVSAFRFDTRGQTPSPHSGNGGYALAAESQQPIFRNLNTPEGLRELGFSAADKRLLAGSTIVSLRASAGDDASCRNLYRTRQPRVIGVPPTLVERDGFAWADKPDNSTNPWRSLAVSPGATAGRGFMDDETPCAAVILEKNTANYALNLWGGLGETFEIADGRGRPLRLQVAALLADSIFQGELLIAERAFIEYFPNVSGYRFFLIETPPEQTTAVRQTLERNLGDYGLAVETTVQRQADFLAVQNTYLSMFQSLGGLGLLLGTFGLAAVQLRSVLERRGELALLRATGFRRTTLAWLVLLEHTVLLSAGLGFGVVAALLAVLPHLLGRVTPLPWSLLAGTLVAVLVLGLAAGGLAVRAMLRAPLLVSLREENL
jgi:putative ABC transport system permease protein